MNQAVGMLGLLVAVRLSRWFGGLLIGVAAFELPLDAAVGLLFALVGAVACDLPARQAVRVDPWPPCAASQPLGSEARATLAW